jgi:hypothetical protein
MMDITDELRALIEAFDKERIEYALCGGMAMAVYGRTRATVDIDLLILPDTLHEVLGIADSLGYTIRGKDLSFKDGAIEIRRVTKIDPDEGEDEREVLPLDLLLVTPAILPIWESRREAHWEGKKLCVVSSDGLVGLKRLRGSAQDLADIESLTNGSPDERS